jgi:hypothetical protein
MSIDLHPSHRRRRRSRRRRRRRRRSRRRRSCARGTIVSVFVLDGSL